MFARKHDEDPADLQAYVKLLTENQWAIRCFIVSLMPGSPDVGDVLQETNLVLWRKRKRFELGTNFLAWASRIARYEVMHYRDRVKRTKGVPFSDELIGVLADAAPAGASGQSHEALLAALDRCLEKLSDKQRELIAQRYTPGNTLEDHAMKIGTTAGSLRVALHRVRQTLKRCVENTLAGETA